MDAFDELFGPKRGENLLVVKAPKAPNQPLSRPFAVCPGKSGYAELLAKMNELAGQWWQCRYEQMIGNASAGLSEAKALEATILASSYDQASLALALANVSSVAGQNKWVVISWLDTVLKRLEQTAS